MESFKEIIPMNLPKRQIAQIILGTLIVARGISGLKNVEITFIPKQ